MKAGRRALGIAESYRSGADTSVLAGAVVRRDRVVDGAAFGTCTVGGTDSTRQIASLYRQLDREDVQYLLLSGVALAWYNIVDLPKLGETLSQPVIAISYEASSGLTAPIADAFEGDDRDQRLQIYQRLPDRKSMTVNGHDLYFRAVGIDCTEARRVIQAFTPEGGRPEPLRVARLLARANQAAETEP